MLSPPLNSLSPNCSVSIFVFFGLCLFFALLFVLPFLMWFCFSCSAFSSFSFLCFLVRPSFLDVVLSLLFGIFWLSRAAFNVFAGGFVAASRRATSTLAPIVGWLLVSFPTK